MTLNAAQTNYLRVETWHWMQHKPILCNEYNKRDAHLLSLDYTAEIIQEIKIENTPNPSLIHIFIYLLEKSFPK